MKTNFDFSRYDWMSDFPLISKHDLVFNAPPFDPVQYGMPIGNGDIGVLTWCENDKIVMVMNKCDLWDDSAVDDFSNWKLQEEESSTVLRHGFRIIIDFGEPVFDEFYISEFEARISLSDGLLTIHSVSPFGKIEVSAFVTLHDDSYGALCCKVKASLKEKHVINLYAERYGSRSFPHWYSRIINDTSVGLSGTEAFAQDDKLIITQKLSSGTFASGIQCGAENFSPERLSSRRLSAKLPEGEECVFYAGITSPGESTGEIINMLETASQKGFDTLYDLSAREWERFWKRSYIETGNDFADNVWALTMFYDRCSQGGKYPGRFIDGLWAPARDYQAWAFYFHWNQQQIYWPLNAAGHHELCEPYLKYRFDSLPKAQRTARIYQKVDNGGAYVSDVCDRSGNNSLSELSNHTPAAEIALDFYRQYKYTCDKVFLAEKALPYMIAAARYIQTLFEKKDDGKYHAIRGTGYEGWIQLSDSTTETACGRALFRAVLEALADTGQSAPEEKLWRDILDNTAPYILDKPYEKYVSEGKIKTGPFKDEEYDGFPVITSGFSINENKSMVSREREGIFPTADKAAVFPSGDIGIKDTGTDLYRSAVNTEKVFAEICSGWDPSAVTAARLGLGDETSKLIDLHIGKWLILNNGWGHYTDSTDYHDRFYNNTVECYSADLKTKTVKPSSEWLFRHMGMECSSVISCALNESLLQSHEGVIRVFPAVKAGASAKFTLHARGGFRVSSEMKDGAILWIAIESLHGNMLDIANPWRSPCCINGDRKTDTGIIHVPTSAGDIIIMTPDADTVFDTEPIAVTRNARAKKHHSGRMLGRESIF